MKPIEMEYRPDPICVVLDKGIKNNYLWCIVSLGTHPTAYVAIQKGHLYFKKKYDKIPIKCHGGLTYSEPDLCFNPIETIPNMLWWVGWDYAHAGDWHGLFPKYGGEQSGRNWTTAQIRKEVFNVITQLTETKVK